MTRTRTLIALAAIATLASQVTQVAGASADSGRQDRLSLGIHAGGGGLSDAAQEGSEDAELSTAGAGLTIRYGLARRWDIELTAEGIVGESETLRRSLAVVTLAGRFRINPDARWRWSVLAGIGTADETSEVLNGSGDAILTREFRHGAFVLGGTLERRFRHLGISAELRAIGLARSDDDLDGPEFAGKESPIPTESSGGELRLQATYYF